MTTGFATYYAKVLIAQEGYRPGTVPEAEELAAACDILLTYSDGYYLRILCIVDREADPGRRFALPPDRLIAIAEACLGYTGRGWTKLPVHIQVMEIGANPLDAVDEARLRSYRRGLPKVYIGAWHVDVPAQRLWVTALLWGYPMGRLRLERLLRGERLPEAELDPKPLALRPPVTRSAAMAVLGLLVAVFALELVLAIGPVGKGLRPSVTTLAALGGLNRTLVIENGQWWRLVTPALLHADIMHLLCNSVALFFGGGMVERLVGRAWLGALFVAGAVGGCLASLVINPVNTVSVGASGAIMALLAAAAVLSHRMPHGPKRTGAQMNIAHVLVPALMPMAASRHVDVAGHLGGALAGLAMAWPLLKTWPRDSVLPRFRRLGLALSIAGTVAAAYAAIPIMAERRSALVVTSLMPPDQEPKTEAEARARWEQLVAGYPRDPRVHLMRARMLLQDRKLAEGEEELRTALAEDEILRTAFKPELEWQIRTSLALVRVERGDRDEARHLAATVCAAGRKTPMGEALTKARLCD